MAGIEFAVRSSAGISLVKGPPTFAPSEDFPEVSSKACKTILFSPDGDYFAYINAQTLNIFNTKEWKKVATISNTKTNSLSFSAKGTFLATWEPFTVGKDNPQGTPNLHIYKSETGERVKSLVHKKQGNWEPQWSMDEKLCCRMVNNDVVFNEDLNFDKICYRIDSFKVASYKISPNVGTYFVLCHTLGGPGQPSFGRLFKYPNFDGQSALANKSFFQADKVEFYWNNKGNNALLLTSTEVDKTGGSYYGKQGLHFMGLNGQTAMVTLSKEGPIYSVEWSPKNQEFCLIYGFMPAKATIFNLKCEPIFELGTGARNSIYYNPHGNMLLLGGFGNLRGLVEVWDAVNKKKISNCDASDTTLLQWAPDGEHFFTATTTPRLRTGNGYKIWHYSGALLHEKSIEELYELMWMKCPKGTFQEPVITEKKVAGIEPSQPKASTQAYRPPSARNKPVVKFSLYDDDDELGNKPGNSTPSKLSVKNKKKREAKKLKKQEEGAEDDSKKPAIVSAVQVTLTGDPEHDKKLRNIKKKLDAIEKLKAQQAEGKTLEINQLEKIKGEPELLKMLEELTV